MYRKVIKIINKDRIFIYSSRKELNNGFYSTTTKRSTYLQHKPKTNLSGWLLLSVPIATFSLGVWQIRRKQWKESLIDDLKKRSDSKPVNLPKSLEEIRKLEYKPVHVRGTFLHDKEIYMGPRSFLSGGDGTSKSSLMTGKSGTGYLVITPFKLEDRDEIILINRGWVSSKKKHPKLRAEGQIEQTTDVVGIVRLTESRPQFSIKNKENSDLYFYRDLEAMSASTGSSPIFLDATNDFDIPGGPIGGQTRVSLRNEHLSYILTWFSLSGITAFMWYVRIYK